MPTLPGLRSAFLLGVLVGGAVSCPGESGPELWSFRPLEGVLIPEGDEKHPIDRFLEERLADEGLEFSAAVAPISLLRRVSLDLTGLPPTPGDVDRFLQAWGIDAESAYTDTVERLLRSPRYGERWGQHWLDAVRYADTHGFEVNTPRPNAWPYRDYVISAFNDDVPYDRFVLDQLAGDTTGKDAATGFLVTAGALLPGQVGQDDESIKRARQDELNEIVINSAATFLGLSVHCARCHDHKFDPVSQLDYYRFQGLFAGVRFGDRPLREVEQDRERESLKVEEEIGEVVASLRDLGVRPPVESRVNEEAFASVRARHVRFTIRRTSDIEPCLDELEVWSVESEGEPSRNVALSSGGVTASSSGDYEDPVRHKLSHINDGRFGNGRSWIAKQAEDGWVALDLGREILIDRIIWGRDREGKFEDRLPLDYVIEVADESGLWSAVADGRDRLSALEPAGLDESQGELVSRYKSLGARLDRLREPQRVFGGTFVKPPPVNLLNRGDVTQPGEEVAPDIPAELGSLGLTGTSGDSERRLALARWIGSRENPLTARVIVNRVWHWHFGVGLVDTPSDFGLMGGMPTHPELLDWLALRFMDDGWSIKNLHRLIVSSRAYRQSGRPRSVALGRDADNRLLWRFRPRRLEAEVLRDSILQVSGVLEHSMGGPGFSLFEPNTNYVRVYEPKENFGPAEWRRMIYAHRVRMEQDGVFGVFDRPDAGLICARREQSTTPLQALNLFNSKFVLDQAERLAGRVSEEGGGGVEEQVGRAFRLCYGRLPDGEELAEASQFIRQHGLPQFCRVLLNSNEFLFMP